MGGAGPGGNDSVSLQHWLLWFGAASGELRLIVAEVEEWLSNGRPPWAAYRAMMSGRMIALDKSPGIRSVGIGETWHRLLEKCLLRVSGQESKAACGTEHLAGGVEAGIKGAIHAVRLQWVQHSHEGDWGFLLVDARKAPMRRTGQPCYGLSSTSGPVVRSSPSTATATGPHLWSDTPRMGQATSCTARRA